MRAAEATSWGAFVHYEYRPSGRYVGGEQIGFIESDTEEWARDHYLGCDLRPPGLLPGQYHPRIWRNGWACTPSCPIGHRYPQAYAAAGRAAAASLHRLLEQLASIFDVIEPTHSNKPAHGPATRHLLLLAAMEVEAAWRGVLVANQHRDAIQGNARLTTNHYVELLRPMRLNEYVLRLALYHDEWAAPIAPFRDWSAQNPTTSLPWYDAYNSAKHDRENQRSTADLEAAVTALAAAFVMLVAQFGANNEFRAVLDHVAGFTFEQTPNWTPEELYFPACEDGFDALPLF